VGLFRLSETTGLQRHALNNNKGKHTRSYYHAHCGLSHFVSSGTVLAHTEKRHTQGQGRFNRVSNARGSLDRINRYGVLSSSRRPLSVLRRELRWMEPLVIEAPQTRLTSFSRTAEHYGYMLSVPGHSSPRCSGCVATVGGGNVSTPDETLQQSSMLRVRCNGI